jgi:cytochrome c peroxidase
MFAGAAAALAAAAGLTGCAAMDRAFCAEGNCGWSEDEVSRVSALADLPEAPPDDPSNKYAGSDAAVQLGRKLFADPRLSGTSNATDALGRAMPFARAPKGQPLNIACATCHDLRRGGIDPATVPGNVSIGASWTDTNTPTVFNAAFQELFLWNGRADSLWAQATATFETAMGCNRARAAWVVASYYRADYTALFTDFPLPMTGTIADLTPSLATDTAHAGQCVMAPDCPASCRLVKDDTTGASACWPRFPLDGKPGKKMGCQPGDATEPFGDAYDCMDPDDQKALTRVTVNMGKAIAAFESKLVSRDSAFDRFAADLRDGKAEDSTAIDAGAKRGARLFVGKAGCSDCHSTPLLSSGDFYNIGVPQEGQAVPIVADCVKGGVCDCVTPSNCLPMGAPDGIAKLHKSPYVRSSAWSDDATDSSRQKYMDADPTSFPRGAFRVPSLRDVALTAPYMHTGAFATLEDVVAHYNRGGDPAAGGDLSARLKPLYLTDDEAADLVAFLRTLTGATLPPDLTDPPDLPK